ncbi:MAG: ribosome biogenesis GTPase Der [Hyphomicrobiales bacterium]|nr:ribosome biogenesis GTPase Der [Hyphomicrobiales bacterium]MCP5373999.1 ribosome biogenesis GTPase Der [Hyphomicrobiales bacterium]
MPFTVAILGRPNVGKSTLFNRLVGKRLAIVDDTPGVTRDRREGEGRISDLRFRVIDTAGLEEAGGETLEAAMRVQTERALDEADVALFLIDARAGVTPMDEHFAHWIRTRPVPVILVANKCEGAAGTPGLMESYALGLGDPVPFSAEHGDGVSDLYRLLRPYADWAEEAEVEADDGDAEADAGAEGGPLQLAIVGRPNVGKSTLINRLIGEERLLTGPEAGVTRDSIAVAWSHEGRPVRLFDTAGLRRKARVTAKVESLSAADALRAVRFAQVVVLVLDGRTPLEKQDLTIARLVIDEGRALVIGINKWDLVDDRRAAMAQVRDRLEASMPRVRGIPVVTFSALTGRGVDRLLPAAFDIFEVWNRRVSTGPLNQWLADVEAHHPPPLAQGRRVRLRYMTQAKTRPPTFALFASQPKAVTDSYLRYLENALRQDFDLPGVPLRILVRGGKNPYAKGAKRG